MIHLVPVTAGRPLPFPVFIEASLSELAGACVLFALYVDVSLNASSAECRDCLLLLEQQHWVDRSCMVVCFH